MPQTLEKNNNRKWIKHGEGSSLDMRMKIQNLIGKTTPSCV